MSTAREVNKSLSQPWTWHGAPRGMVKNAPHSDLPDGAVVYLRNCHAHPTEIQPRPASDIYTTITPPVKVDSDSDYQQHITASKTGNVITASDDIFESNNISDYFVWPGNPDIHEEIQVYLSPTQVRVATSGDRVSTSGCWIHPKLNLFEQHSTMKKIVLQWGKDIYVADNLNISSWSKVYCVSYETLNNTLSTWDEQEDYGVIGNSAGIFLLYFDIAPGILFKRNTAVPTIVPESNVRTREHKYRYDVTYSMSRIAGVGIRSRATGAVVLQESGTCKLDPTFSPPRDYGTQWTTRRIDIGAKTQGRLIGDELNDTHKTPTYWQGQDEITFQATVNEVTKPFVVDMSSTGYYVTSMDEVARAFEETIQVGFPFITFEWDAENERFVMTSGVQNGSTLGYFTEGLGGTDHSSIMKMTEDKATTLDNDYAYAYRKSFETFYVPEVVTAPGTPAWHWTHYTRYRSEDIGPDGVTPRVDSYTGQDLPPIKFTWVDDIRVAGAFLASRDGSGIITAHIGEFQMQDEGTPFEWQDGEIDTLGTYIDAKHMSISSEYYYADTKAQQAAAIGGGDVILGSQSGGTITVEGGDTFDENDVGKTIFWSDGTWSIIVEYIDSEHVIVHDSRTRVSQGLTLDPVSRVITDITSDEVLRDRQGELNVGLLQHRFYLPMPPCNRIVIVPGFLVGAQSNKPTVYYSQLGVAKAYLGGYHIESRQKIDRIKQPVQWIEKIASKFIIWCNNSTWGGASNLALVKELPEFGEAFAILQADVIDARIGCLDYGSIQDVDRGVFELRCSDGSWRQFNGFQYTEDMSIDNSSGQDIVQKDLSECWDLSNSCYHDKVGHIWWGKVSS